MITMTSSTNTF